MRSYAQYCPLAMGLDIVGERWTLLIVRELGVRSARYRDLHEALPGIATNLLADRLRMLTAAGVIETTTTPPPAVATVYVLTEWGRELYAIVVRLGRWGARTLLGGSTGRTFRARYTIPVIQALYSIDADLRDLEPLTVRIEYEGERVHVTADATGVAVALDDDDLAADVTLDGPPETIVGLLAGVLDPRDHTGVGFSCESGEATRRFRALTQRAVRTA